MLATGADHGKSKLLEVARLFLKLGFTAFGGPAAHIAMMRHEIVEKRGWMDEQHFLDLIGATNLIPGPNSTEMAIHIGQERAGGRGLIVAGACFIMPAVVITGVFAWLYKQYGQLPAIQPFIYGIKPAIIAIVLAAIYPLAKKSLKTAQLIVIGVTALVLSLMGMNEIYIMFGAGFVLMAYTAVKGKYGSFGAKSVLPLPFLQILNNQALAPVSNFSLFLTFLKIGSILYGSGYVLFAFLDSELVAKGLLTRRQLVDAIAVGQFTPGPVFSSVTFIGYQLSGMPGAVVSTLGIFLPSFVFVAALNPLVKKMRTSKLFSVFLDAVNVASVAIIAAVCYQMGREAINDWRTVSIAIISVLAAFGFRKLNSAWVVLGSALVGYLLTFITL